MYICLYVRTCGSCMLMYGFLLYAVVCILAPCRKTTLPSIGVKPINQLINQSKATQINIMLLWFNETRHLINAVLELGNITILSFIVILLFIVVLKCHHNWYWREIFSIIILSMWYYHKYCNYCKIYCSETCTSEKCFHFIFTVLVAVEPLSDIMI